MQTTTLSCFRFDTTANKLWAFGQMQFARAPLQKTPGVSFAKLMGSGTGESFHPRPNFGVYAVLLIWRDEETAREGLAKNPILANYRDRASERFELIVQPQHTWGRWDGKAPFDAQKDGLKTPSPIGVLTRATLRTDKLLQFWRSVPSVSKAIADDPGCCFKLGLGEVPWIQQVTFSIWTDMAAMRTFAYRSGAHADAIRQAKTNTWFKEDLFARFHILETRGTWYAEDPLASLEAVPIAAE